MVFAYPETNNNYNVEKNENVKYTNTKVTRRRRRGIIMDERTKKGKE